MAYATVQTHRKAPIEYFDASRQVDGDRQEFRIRPLASPVTRRARCTAGARVRARVHSELRCAKRINCDEFPKLVGDRPKGLSGARRAGTQQSTHFGAFSVILKIAKVTQIGTPQPRRAKGVEAIGRVRRLR
jgi:hypothetical protein